MVYVCLTIRIYMKNNCGLKTTCGKYFISWKILTCFTHSFYVDTLLCSLWKCSSRNRTNSTPHIKTYCRISSCCTKMSWFLLTSANLSKSAWGRKLKTDEDTSLIMAHEAGVLFLPQFVVVIYFLIC